MHAAGAARPDVHPLWPGAHPIITGADTERSQRRCTAGDDVPSPPGRWSRRNAADELPPTGTQARVINIHTICPSTPTSSSKRRATGAIVCRVSIRSAGFAAPCRGGRAAPPRAHALRRHSDRCESGARRADGSPRACITKRLPAKPCGPGALWGRDHPLPASAPT